MPELRESRGNLGMSPSSPQHTQRQILAASASGPAKDPIWKKAGAAGPLDDVSRSRAIEAVQNLYYSSPLASRIIEQLADFVVGEHGFTLTSHNTEAADVLYEFWRSPINAIPQMLYDIVQEYFVYGEAAFLVKVNHDGFVGITYVSSPDISDVKPVPGEPNEPDVITVGQEDYDVIRWDNTNQKLAGDAFFFRSRHLGANVRGVPRLLPMVDFIRAWDSFTYNYLRRRSMYDSVWWEVELEGFTQDQIIEWLNSPHSNPPQSGSVFAHNEKVDWTLQQPSFEKAALESDGGFLLGFLEGSAGLSEYTHTTQARRRERGEMLDPVARGLSARQFEIRSIFRRIGDFVVQEGKRAGQIDSKAKVNVLCRAPRLGVRDIQRSSGALLKYVESLTKAVTEGWISDERARKLFTSIVDRLDLGEQKPIGMGSTP